jgi:hypothetical protein
MISSDAGSEAIARGIRDGAQYFLAKPVEPAMLLAVVSASLQAAAEARRARDALPQTALALGLLRQARFTIRTFDDCRLLARALAPLCPRADGAVLALQELMFNAVEHGNLGIDYATKSALLLADRYHDELERRLGDPVLGRRRASVDLQRDDTGVRIHITDEGDGFAWEPYLELSAERMFDAHGRGIPMARLSGVDRLDYLGKGNEVLLQWERRPDDQV